MLDSEKATKQMRHFGGFREGSGRVRSWKNLRFEDQKGGVSRVEAITTVECLILSFGACLGKCFEGADFVRFGQIWAR